VTFIGENLVLAASYGSVEDIEVLWTLLALIGLIFSIYNTREALRDRTALIESRTNGDRLRIANSIIISEITRVIKQIIFLVIGVIALTLTAAPTTQMNIKQILIGVAIRWGLIIASGLTTYQAFIAFRLRRVLNR